MLRKNPLINDHYYHVFTRSIAKYVIFKSSADYHRLIATCRFYRIADSKDKFSQSTLSQSANNRQNHLVDIVAFCLMPTHIHLILRQRVGGGITDFMRRTLNSYSHYFNLKYGRRGPLWEGRFKSKLIDNDEYLLAATLYIHANPLKAMLIKNAKDWPYSSCREYLDVGSRESSIIQPEFCLNILPEEYEFLLTGEVLKSAELGAGDKDESPFDY